MRVMVLGAGGMLGHKAFQLFSQRFETVATFRRFDARLRATGLFPEHQVIDGVDAADVATVRRAIGEFRPDCVLNCVGIIKQLKEATDARVSIYTNALYPHLLAEICGDAGTRLVHISTDCVFSGKRGQYVEQDQPDAEDLYGRTKYLGEVDYPHAVTVRTSIIGRELFSRVSLVDWFLSQQGGRVRGFTNAIFSGFTTIALSRELARIIENLPHLSGVYQVSCEPISKFELLELLGDCFDVDVEIEPYDAFRCDRSLRSDRYRAETGFRPPAWPEMIEEMAQDETPYGRFRGATSDRIGSGIPPAAEATQLAK